MTNATTRAAATVAALAVACAVVVGCGSTTAGVPVAGVTPKAATMTVPEAPAATAPVQRRWMDVTGEGIEAPRDDIDGAQLGPVPLPGLQVLHAINADGDLDGCTLGPAIRSVDGSRSGFLTAGHCGLGPYASEQYYQPTAAGEPEFLATATGAENDEAAGIDSAALWVPGGIGPRATRVAGFPVDRVMSAAEVRSSLPVGTPVCVNGARAGVKCSALAKIPTSTILYGEVTHTGDSGAPVFVVDAETRRAIVIGIHEAVNGGYSEATFAEPALARLGAELATAP